MYTDYIDKAGGAGLVVGQHEDGRWKVLVAGIGKVYYIEEARLKPATVEDTFGISPVYVLNQPNISVSDIRMSVFWGGLMAGGVFMVIGLAIYLLNMPR